LVSLLQPRLAGILRRKLDRQGDARAALEIIKISLVSRPFLLLARLRIETLASPSGCFRVSVDVRACLL
jgi:hypothetical protein